MSGTAEKARRLRLERLEQMLDEHLSHPPAALETLVTELKEGHAQAELWEKMHAAAARDGQESRVAESYSKIAIGRRLKQLTSSGHTQVLMHAADYHQGILGSWELAEPYLLQVLEIDPNHENAFERLQQRYQSTDDKVKLVDLLAKVAKSHQGDVEARARKAGDLITLLPARSPLSEQTCLALVQYAGTSIRVIDNLDAHCCKTGRAELAAQIHEAALSSFDLPEATAISQKRRLVELYLGDAKQPAKAIGHVEALLNHNGLDSKARAAANKLLSVADVASRAAASLQRARQSSRAPAP